MGSSSDSCNRFILAHLNGYLHDAMTFSNGHWPIGVGMWLAIIMFLNVWLVIWPNQESTWNCK